VGSCWLRTVNLPEASSLRHSVQARSIVTNGQTIPRRAHCSRVQIRLRLQRSEVKLGVFADAQFQQDIHGHGLPVSSFVASLCCGNRYSQVERSISWIRTRLPIFRAGRRPHLMCRLTVRSDTCQRIATSWTLNQRGDTLDADFVIIVSIGCLRVLRMLEVY
jgi:hypothetical protein